MGLFIWSLLTTIYTFNVTGNVLDCDVYWYLLQEINYTGVRHFCQITQPRICYRLWACHHGCWCGCWLHSSCSLSGHFGWSLQGWQAGEPGESGQWENCACPVGTYGHRWSGFLQQDTYKGWDICDAVVHSNVYIVEGLNKTKRWKKKGWSS